MINDTLKEKITPYLKDCLLQKDYKFIDYMFSECYESTIEGVTLITLKPPIGEDDIAMQFNKSTGEFVEITSWDYIQEQGDLL